MNKLRVLVEHKTSFLLASLEGFFYLFFNRISAKWAGLLLVLITFFFAQGLFPTLGLASSNQTATFKLTPHVATVTESLFTEKTTLKIQVLPFSKQVKVDATLSTGEEKVVQSGRNGARLLETTIVYHNGTEYSHETKVINETPAQDEIVTLGISSGGELSTPWGNFTYANKLTVWATSYDSTCPGCNQTTATGLKAGYGVIAVDPKTIPLGTKVYIPGYGVAVAGDTGGAIKGNRIDVGFDNLKNASWTAHFTDIYLLTN